MNERATGTFRPRRTPHWPQTVEPSLRAVKAFLREVEPAAVLFEKWSPARPADPPTKDRTGEIPERAGGAHGKEGGRAGADLRPEEAELGGGDPGRDGAGVEHDELAAGRKDRIDGHQHERRIDAVGCNLIRQRGRETGQHSGQDRGSALNNA